MSAVANDITGEVYSIGYQLRSPDDLVDELRRARVDVLVDVRETPWSHRREYSKKALSKLLEEAGIQYVHLKLAGNPKVLRQSSATHLECLDRYDAYLQSSPWILRRLTRLLELAIITGRRVCLFCYERHPADCHRSILLARCMEGLGGDLSVTHLDPEGAPRFTD